MLDWKSSKFCTVSFNFVGISFHGCRKKDIWSGTWIHDLWDYNFLNRLFLYLSSKSIIKTKSFLLDIKTNFLISIYFFFSAEICFTKLIIEIKIIINDKWKLRIWLIHSDKNYIFSFFLTCKLNVLISKNYFEWKTQEPLLGLSSTKSKTLSVPNDLFTTNVSGGSMEVTEKNRRYSDDMFLFTITLHRLRYPQG